MTPLLHPSLVNDRFGDPALYVDVMFEKRGLLFDLGDLHALEPRKILKLSDVFVSPFDRVPEHLPEGGRVWPELRRNASR